MDEVSPSSRGVLVELVALLKSEDDPAVAIADSGLLETLSESSIARRLADRTFGPATEINRRPHPKQVSKPGISNRCDAAVELFEADRRLDSLRRLDGEFRLDALLRDTGLLADALELIRTCGDGEVSKAITGALPEWPLRSDSAVRALDVVARCERADFDSAPPALCGLDAREKRFELSLGRHLHDHGFFCAIRAAIAFCPGPETDVDTQQIRHYLGRCSHFFDEPPLLELATALVSNAGLCGAHLRGEAPLADLSGWVGYLRDDTARLAKSRQIDRREALHHAHYALHFVDICLMAEETSGVDSSTRTRLLDLEEGLKAFAAIDEDRPSRSPAASITPAGAGA